MLEKDGEPEERKTRREERWEVKRTEKRKKVRGRKGRLKTVWVRSVVLLKLLKETSYCVYGGGGADHGGGEERRNYITKLKREKTR